MRIFDVIKSLMVWMAILMSLPALSQSNVAPSASADLLSEQQLMLEQEKQKVMAQFQVASKACWKKFAVNDCLAEARRQKYQSLAPLEKQTLQLNEQQRELKEAERLQRLSDKLSNKGTP